MKDKLLTANIGQVRQMLKYYFHGKEVKIKEIAFGNNYRDFKTFKLLEGGVLDITFELNKSSVGIEKKEKTKHTRKERRDKGQIKEKTIRSIQNAPYYVMEDPDDEFDDNYNARFWCIAKYGKLYWKTQTVTLIGKTVFVTNEQNSKMFREFDSTENAEVFFKSIMPKEKISSNEAEKIIVKKTKAGVAS